MGATKSMLRPPFVAVLGVTIIIVATCVDSASCFLVPASRRIRQARFRSHCKDTSSPSSSILSPLSLVFQSRSLSEYEYLPLNNAATERGTTLESVYPPGTPAGLRGEAVRTALKSTQCLAWKRQLTAESSKSSPNLASGILHLEGPGSLDFLNNKLTNSFRPTRSVNDKDDQLLSVTQACLLTPKGRLVDTLCIAFGSNEAFLIPSPGHLGSDLFERLDPFIFPIDQVTLKDLSDTSTMFTVASTKREHVDSVFRQQFLPKMQALIPNGGTLSLDLPIKDKSVIEPLGSTTQRLLIIPHTGLPECACEGYTFVFLNDKTLGNSLWEYLVGEGNSKGPVELKALEYETFRIEAGQPAYGWEVTGAWKDSEPTPASPLELHQGTTTFLDVDKGCYLGQEGIASVLKNPRGPPRSLYAVVFDDDDNQYNSDYEDDDDEDTVDNRTQRPRPGDPLFVLGGNEQVAVGTITSVAEPYGTGDTTTIALALVRRADSVLKQMKSKDLQIPKSMAHVVAPAMATASTSSGMIPAPPRDPLQGLEVIVGGTFTVGTLQSIPSRRLPRGKNMFDDQAPVFLTREEIIKQGYVDIEFAAQSAQAFLQEKVAVIETTRNRETSPEKADDNIVNAVAAEAEAKRKAEKLELLKKRAEEAMTRRKQQQAGGEASATSENIPADGAVSDDDAAAAEAKRKAEKMELLRKQAEAAMARRRRKKEQQG